MEQNETNEYKNGREGKERKGMEIKREKVGGGRVAEQTNMCVTTLIK